MVTADGFDNGAQAMALRVLPFRLVSAVDAGLAGAFRVVIFGGFGVVVFGLVGLGFVVVVVEVVVVVVVVEVVLDEVDAGEVVEAACSDEPPHPVTRTRASRDRVVRRTRAPYVLGGVGALPCLRITPFSSVCGRCRAFACGHLKS
jgi:hypothetical protein